MEDVSRAHARLLETLGGDAALGPGESVAFTAVFPELPKDFDQAKGRYRFDVRLGSYTPPGGGPADVPKMPKTEGADVAPAIAPEPPEGPVEEFFGPPHEG